MTETPTGKRFSQVYLAQPDLLPDSNRLRTRLATLYGDTPSLSKFGQKLQQELGIRVSAEAYYASFWPGFMAKIELRDVLDSVTVRYQTLNAEHYDPTGQEASKLRALFLGAVRRIFAEEQVRYRIDNKAGVHFAVDAEFENNRVSTIARLGPQRYSAVRLSYDEAFSALDRIPPDGKAAIRSAFFAVEGLFRLMFPSAHQLSASEVQKHLKPLIDEKLKDQKPAIYLAQKQVAAFCDWIDGAHFYRHEPGSEEPAQPPLSLAVYMISQSGSHLRWLAEFDA